MGRNKTANDAKQTLKQAKAAFKARGSTHVSEAEKRRLERGAILLQRAERLREQAQRRKDISKKKTNQDPKAQQACLLGTQVRLDKFGYKSSQFHLGAFLKPKAPAAPLPVQKEESLPEPWEDDHVDDDTLLHLASESPVATTKGPSAQLPSQQTPNKSQLSQSHRCPSTADDFANWDDFLERSSQIARELSTDQKPAPTPSISRSLDRIPSFTSTDFDLSVDDLEELDMVVDGYVPPQPEARKPIVQEQSRRDEINKTQSVEKQAATGSEMDRTLMPPPKIPAKHLPPKCTEITARPSPHMVHGITFADLESLAGEEIQLSQFGDF